MMKIEKFEFNVPQTISYNKIIIASAVVDLIKGSQALDHIISAKGKREGKIVNINKKIKAHLTGSNFDILPITPESQSMSSLRLIQWKWEITPKKPGNHQLHIDLSAFFDLNNENKNRSLKRIDKLIEVRISLFQKMQLLFKNNWQWLWTTVLIPLLLWLKQNRNKKFFNKDLDHQNNNTEEK